MYIGELNIPYLGGTLGMPWGSDPLGYDDVGIRTGTDNNPADAGQYSATEAGK